MIYLSTLRQHRAIQGSDECCVCKDMAAEYNGETEYKSSKIRVKPGLNLL